MCAVRRDHERSGAVEVRYTTDAVALHLDERARARARIAGEGDQAREVVAEGVRHLHTTRKLNDYEFCASSSTCPKGLIDELSGAAVSSRATRFRMSSVSLPSKISEAAAEPSPHRASGPLRSIAPTARAGSAAAWPLASFTRAPLVLGSAPHGSRFARDSPGMYAVPSGARPLNPAARPMAASARRVRASTVLDCACGGSPDCLLRRDVTWDRYLPATHCQPVTLISGGDACAHKLGCRVGSSSC